ncbi:MAG: hypothetical protein ABSB89_01035 [Candidatus Bathyarchaeia archaeon]
MENLAEEQKKRIEEEKKKRLQTIEIQGQTEARKNATDDGNKKEQDIHDEVVEGEDYPFTEGR